MPITASVRLRLLEARRSLRLSQRQLAARAGITQAHYNLIERGLRDPSLQVAFRLAQVLGADPRDLFADVMERIREAS